MGNFASAKDELSAEAPRRRSDGAATHSVILEAAMRLASIEGLSSLTIGRLSQELGVSKSGVFAHFRSKERLQRETIDAARAIFEREVIEPGFAAPEGVARLAELCEAYMSYVERRVFPGGCFFAHLLAEYDARTGPLHDAVVSVQRGWLGLLEQQIVAGQRLGELDTAVNPARLAFDLYAPIELANYLSTLNHEAGPIEHARASLRETLARAATPTERPIERDTVARRDYR